MQRRDDDQFGFTRRAALASGLTAMAMVTAGRLSAAPAQKAQAYRSIRYARAERFGQANLLPFTESLIQRERGAICPQMPSRLEISMGPQAPNRQDEHCQLLSVFTPSRTGKRPVLVYLHGGAYVSGGGELPWYDGDLMAAEQDIVVVPVTYRLGALGFWVENGSSNVAPGLSDMIAALKWVQQNIEKFGGDPANVTVAGQSAGAAAVRSLIQLGYGQKLFHRAIRQSAGIRQITRQSVEAQSRRFDEVLAADPRKASVEQILAAQTALTKLNKGEPGWSPNDPSAPASINVDMMAGWTSDELSAHMMLAQGKKPVPGASLEPYREAGKMFTTSTTAYAVEAAKSGQTSYLYSFDWNGPDTGMGNCHCIELAFLFGDRAAWEAAPMLAGVNWADYERLGKLMRAQWAGFARNSNPNVAGGPKWLSVTPDAASVTSLG